MSIKTFADLKAPWFHMRGSCVYDVKNEWQNSQFVTVLDSGDYVTGDRFVLECAKHFKTDAAWKDHFNKFSNFGTTAKGELSFGDAFAKLLKCHGMLLDSKTVAPGGITFNGYNTAVSSIESRGKGGIILGTYIVGRLALSLSKDWASVRVGYYDIPCLGSGGDVVSCRIRETDFSIRRPHKPGGAGVVETDEKIITKFLKFALSLSDLSFPNICEIYVYCGQPVNGRISMDQISEELAKATEKKTPYANPNIFYDFRSGAQTMKTQFLLRPLSDELTEVLRNCKCQPSFFGKTNNRYWGDYLVSRAMQTPFEYGKTVEETAINCIEYCIDHKWANYPASMVAEDVGGTTNATEPSASSLFDMEDASAPMETPPEPALPEPAHEIDLAALADVDWSLMDEEETETAAFVGDVSLDEFGEWTEEDDFGEWTDEDEFAEDEEDVVAMFDSAENDASFEEDSKVLSEADLRDDFIKFIKAARAEYRSAPEGKKSYMQRKAMEMMQHPWWLNHKPRMTEDGRYFYPTDMLKIESPMDFAEQVLFVEKMAFHCCSIENYQLVSWGYQVRSTHDLKKMSTSEWEAYHAMALKHDREKCAEFFKNYLDLDYGGNMLSRPYPLDKEHDRRLEIKREERRRQREEQRRQKEEEQRRQREEQRRQKEEEQRRQREEEQRRQKDNPLRDTVWLDDFVRAFEKNITCAFEDHPDFFKENPSKGYLDGCWDNSYAYMGYYLVRNLQETFDLGDVQYTGPLMTGYLPFGKTFFRRCAGETSSLYEDVCKALSKGLMELEDIITSNDNCACEDVIRKVTEYKNCIESLCDNFSSAMSNHYADLRGDDFVEQYNKLYCECEDALNSLQRTCWDVPIPDAVETSVDDDRRTNPKLTAAQTIELLDWLKDI